MNLQCWGELRDPWNREAVLPPFCFVFFFSRTPPYKMFTRSGRPRARKTDCGVRFLLKISKALDEERLAYKGKRQIQPINWLDFNDWQAKLIISANHKTQFSHAFISAQPSARNNSVSAKISFGLKPGQNYNSTTPTILLKFMIRFCNHNAEKYPFNPVKNSDKEVCRSNFFAVHYSTKFYSFVKVQWNISSYKIALGKVAFSGSWKTNWRKVQSSS